MFLESTHDIVEPSLNHLESMLKGQDGLFLRVSKMRDNDFVPRDREVNPHLETSTVKVMAVGQLEHDATRDESRAVMLQRRRLAFDELGEVWPRLQTMKRNLDVAIHSSPLQLCVT